MATTQPLKSTADLDKVRDVLTNNRDRALFECGVGTAFRGGDLLGLKLQDVMNLKEGDEIVIREQKTLRKNEHGKIISKAARRVKINGLVADALAALVAERLEQRAKPDSWLFISQSGNQSEKGAALSNVSLSRSWKHWCSLAGLQGVFGAHTGRKSLGYLSRVEDKLPIEVIAEMYGHASVAVTRAYICVQPEEVNAIHMKNRTNRGVQ